MTQLDDALQTLTADQPMQPVDRLGAVTRKAKRIRRTRALVSGTAALAVLASGGALLQQRHEATTHFAHEVVTDWPDRSYTNDRGVAEGAVAVYRRFASLDNSLVEGQPRWLFRGTVALPDHDDLYVAVYVIKHSGKNVVVTSQSRRSQVDSKGIDVNQPGDESSSSWVYHEQPLTKQLDHIGVYVGYQGQDRRTDPTTQVTVDDQRSFLLLLADPAARSVTWTQHPVPFAAEGSGRGFLSSGSLRTVDGLFVGDAGGLLGPVTVDLKDKHGNVRVAGALSTTSHLDLARPTVPQVPAGWTQHFGAAGTTEQQTDGSWDTGASFSDGSDYPNKVAAIEARCYGGGSLLFTMALSGSSTVVASGRVACDGQSHEALRHVAGPRGFDLQVSGADRLIALQYVGGTVG
jgi:hypothetical protein